MTNETMAAATDILRSAGVDAEFMYPGFIRVVFDRSDGSGQNQRQTLTFGDNNPPWFGGQIYAGESDLQGEQPIDSIDADVPVDSADPKAVAHAILKIVRGEA